MNQIIWNGLSLEDLMQLIEERAKKATLEALVSYNATNKEEEYTSAKEVCAKLKISRPTLDSYSRKGIIPKHPLGGKIYFKASEVEAAINRISSPSKSH